MTNRSYHRLVIRNRGDTRRVVIARDKCANGATEFFSENVQNDRETSEYIVHTLGNHGVGWSAEPQCIVALPTSELWSSWHGLGAKLANGSGYLAKKCGLGCDH